MTNLLDGQQVPLYGDGGNVRGWIHVDDHCRGIQLVLERGRPGEIYNIDGDAELTNLELTAALLECCGAGLGHGGPRRRTARGTTGATPWTTQQAAGAGLRAADPVPPGPGGDGALVCRTTAPGGNR